jgi:hypothetical protein
VEVPRRIVLLGRVLKVVLRRITFKAVLRRIEVVRRKGWAILEEVPKMVVPKILLTVLILSGKSPPPNDHRKRDQMLEELEVLAVIVNNIIIVNSIIITLQTHDKARRVRQERITVINDSWISMTLWTSMQTLI